jgi:FSR family fosmidomycin resistance protein-like MFS transporter
MVLSFLFFCSAAATVIGGHLADRIGLNNLVKITWIILIPSLFLITKITNPYLVVLLLVPVAIGLSGNNTPMILLGQKYLPENIGFASGVTLGLAVSIGGITAPFLGNYADRNGLPAIFGLLCFLPLIGAIVSLTLKPPRKA